MVKTNKANIGLIAAILFFILVNASTVLAEGLPGSLDETGTHFEITDSPHFNFSLESSEPIKVMIQAMPKTIFANIEPVSEALSTTITVSGFTPLTTYYKYEDSFRNLTEFTTDEFGSYTYVQDLSKTHLLIIQSYPGTLFINDDPTGGDCNSVGIWDASNQTCTITTNITEKIEIESDGITLDGGGQIFSTYIFANGRKDLTITNIDTGDIPPVGDEFGLQMLNSSNITIKDNKFSNRISALNLQNLSNSTIIGNTFNSNIWGIVAYYSNNILIKENNFLNSLPDTDPYPRQGICLKNSNSNQVYNNNFIDNDIQAKVISGADNIFNLPAPTGGNYWNDANLTDNDNDGFADNPYIFTGGEDNLPLVNPIETGGEEDTTPPEIQITTPQLYGLYEVGVQLEFTATDESDVASVKGKLTKTDGEWPEVLSGFPVTEPGVYKLVVTAIDNAGNIATSTVESFVVYDPEGGFATGGGWFYPDAESSLAPEGRANFGFVAKYKKGISTGNLEFQYKNGDGINLKSMTIDWLVISETSAQFQGTATINGEDLYTFRVRAKDEGESGADVDHFDIKIWKGTNTEADPVHSAKNTLDGGNIVIHKKK